MAISDVALERMLAMRDNPAPCFLCGRAPAALGVYLPPRASMEPVAYTLCASHMADTSGSAIAVEAKLAAALN